MQNIYTQYNIDYANAALSRKVNRANIERDSKYVRIECAKA